MKAVDFTNGKISRNLIIFCLPLIAGELLQNLYHCVDQLVVGNFVGDTALAAVNSAIPIMEFLIGFFNGLGIGVSVVVSQAFGTRNYTRIQSETNIAFTFSLILGAVSSILGYLLIPSLLRLTGVSAVLYHDANIYLKICFGGLVFTITYNIGAGLLRASGDTTTPFLILLASCIFNLLLDFITVGILQLQVAGAGLATIFSQFFSVILVYLALRKKNPGFGISFPKLFHNPSVVRNIIKIGIPSGLQNSLISVSNMFVWRYINTFPSSAAAGIGAAQRVQQFLSLPSKGFGLTLTTLVSQNYGAGNTTQCREGTKKCMVLSISTILILSSLICLFASPCIAVFNSDHSIVKIGANMIRTVIPFYFLQTIRDVYIGALRGYGNAKAPMWIALLGMIGVRQLYLFIAMQLDYNLRHIYICYPIAWIVTATLITSYYLYFIKKREIS